MYAYERTNMKTIFTIWALALIVLVIIVVVDARHAPKAPMACDVYFSDNGGICLRKTDGYGHLIPFTEADNSIIFSRLCHGCTPTKEGK